MQELIVDGYNIIHAWPALKTVLRERGLEDARRHLIGALAGYSAQTGVVVTVVFDAHARRGSAPSAEVIDGVTVRFGSRTASADHVIERAAYQAAQRGDAQDVVVATDDRLQRAVVGAMGVGTMSALSLAEDVARVAAEVAGEAHGRRDERHRAGRLEEHLDPSVRERLERIRRGSQGEPPDATVTRDDQPA